MPRLSCCPEMCPVCCLLGLSHNTGGLSCDSFCNLAGAPAKKIIFFLSRVCGLPGAKARLKMSQRLATVVAQLLVVPVVLKLVCIAPMCWMECDPPLPSKLEKVRQQSD